MRSVLRTAAKVAAISGLVCLLAGAASGQDAAALRGKDAPPGAIWLDSLDVSKVEQDWGKPGAGCSVEKHPLRIHGVSFVHGLGTHAQSEMWIDLKRARLKFLAMVGVDDETGGKGSVGFEVWVDGKKAADTGPIKGGSEAKLLSVDLRGARQLHLLVNDADDGIDFDHADWAGALLLLDATASARPESVAVVLPPAPPIARENSPLPAIHSPTITGSTPGRPFLFLVPASGEPPLAFSAKNLPGRAGDRRKHGDHHRFAQAGGDHRGRDQGHQRPRRSPRKPDHRRRAAQAGAHAALGLELVELLGGRGQRREGAGGGRRHGQERSGRPRLPVHQHRRHLGGQARRPGRDPVELQVPRHEGPGRLRPWQGLEAGDLFLARPHHLRRLRGQLAARAAGCRIRMRGGASTI